MYRAAWNEDHIERKLVVGVTKPEGASVEMWRINTSNYDKDVFLQMK